MSVKDEFGTCCIFRLDLIGFELDGFFFFLYLHHNLDMESYTFQLQSMEATKYFNKIISGKSGPAVDVNRL